MSLRLFLALFGVLVVDFVWVFVSLSLVSCLFAAGLCVFVVTFLS